MHLTNLLLLLLSNGLTIRIDVSILYSRIAIFKLMFCIISTYESFYITFIEKGLGLYNGLFNATSVTHVFQAFIYITSLIILLLTGFYPRKLDGFFYAISSNTSSSDSPFNKRVEKIQGKEQYTNNEYSEGKKELKPSKMGQVEGKEKKNNKLINLIINKKGEQFTIIEYALIILFVITGGTLLLSSGDFISLFLSLELQSYGLYILCVIYRESESATSSGLTYFLLGGLSSCFILLGIVYIYINTGVSSLDSFYLLTNLSYVFLSEWYNNIYITYSLLIISVGLLFKIGGAPFHFWTPDVYDGIPTIVTTFVANMAKISILILMLDIVHYTSEFSAVKPLDWTMGILISSLLSLIIGSVLGLSQTRIKRLFAYSTISHLGFILLSLSVNTIESSKAFMFYIMQYTLTNINAFIILIAIGFSLYLHANNNNLNFSLLKDIKNSPIQLISQIKGYFYINPALALCLSLVMLSFIGLPPLTGFFAKLMVLSSALDNGFMFLALIAIITSVIGAVYYLNILKTMFFEKNDYTKLNLDLTFTLSNGLSVPVAILTSFVLIFIFSPNEPIFLNTILSIVSYTDGRTWE